MYPKGIRVLALKFFTSYTAEKPDWEQGVWNGSGEVTPQILNGGRDRNIGMAGTHWDEFNIQGSPSWLCRAGAPLGDAVSILQLLLWPSPNAPNPSLPLDV